MRLAWEKWYPLIVGAVFGVVWWEVCPKFPEHPDNLLMSSLTLGSILTGFLATTKAILISLKNARVMRDLHRSNYINDLVNYLAFAIWMSFGYALLALVGLFLDQTSKTFSTIWFVAGVVTALAFIRVTSLMFKILRYRS